MKREPTRVSDRLDNVLWAIIQKWQEVIALVIVNSFTWEPPTTLTEVTIGVAATALGLLVIYLAALPLGRAILLAWQAEI